MSHSINSACDSKTFKEACMSLLKKGKPLFHSLYIQRPIRACLYSTSHHPSHQSIPCAPCVPFPCSPWKHPLLHKGSHVISSYCWTDLLTTPFLWVGIINASCVFSVSFSWSYLSLEINLYLALSSVRSAHKPLWFSSLWQWFINPISSSFNSHDHFQT